ADAYGAAHQLPGICLRSSTPWHRRRASLEFLLDCLPVEMEYALAASRSSDLHVDLRHGSAGHRKHSARPREALVFRFPPAARSRAIRTPVALFLPVDYCRRLPVARHASIVPRCANAAGGRTRPSLVADTLVAILVPGCGHLYVVRMRRRNHHVVL